MAARRQATLGGRRPGSSASVRPRALLGALVPGLATVVTLTACGSSTPAPPSGANSPRSSITATQGCTRDDVDSSAVTIPIPAATVTLDDGGGQPRQVYSVTPRQSRLATLFTNSQEVSVVGGQTSGGNSDVTLRLDARPVCDSAAGAGLNAGLNTVIFDIVSATSTDALLDAGLSREAGTRVGVQLGADGAPRQMRISAPAGVADTAHGAFEQALLQTLNRSLPLPDAPIGVGARWTVTRTLAAETTLTQTLQATLVGVAATEGGGAQLTIDVNADESPSTSLFRIPGGSGASLTIGSYTMAGNSRIVLDTAAPVPASGGVILTGGRTLIGDEPGRPLVQKTGFVYRWQ